MSVVVGSSLYSNGKKLFNTEKRPGNSQIHCLNGMRFLSMSWVVVAHCYGFGRTLIPFNNYFDVYPVSLKLRNCQTSS